MLTLKFCRCHAFTSLFSVWNSEVATGVHFYLHFFGKLSHIYVLNAEYLNVAQMWAFWVNHIHVKIQNVLNPLPVTLSIPNASA